MSLLYLLNRPNGHYLDTQICGICAIGQLLIARPFLFLALRSGFLRQSPAGSYTRGRPPTPDPALLSACGRRVRTSPSKRQETINCLHLIIDEKEKETALSVRKAPDMPLPSAPADTGWLRQPPAVPLPHPLLGAAGLPGSFLGLCGHGPGPAGLVAGRSLQGRSGPAYGGRNRRPWGV